MGFDHLILEDVNWKDELLVPPTAGDVKAPEDFGNEAWDYLQGVNQKRVEVLARHGETLTLGSRMARSISSWACLGLARVRSLNRSHCTPQEMVRRQSHRRC